SALEASVMVARAFQAHMQAVAPVKAEFGLSGARYDLLRALVHAGRPLKMNEIARRLLVTPTNVTRLVTSLIEEGLLRRIDSPEDRRAVLIEPTQQGEQLYE